MSIILTLTAYSTVAAIGLIIFEWHSSANSPPPRWLMIFGPILSMFEAPRLSCVTICMNALGILSATVLIVKQMTFMWLCYFICWLCVGFVFYATIAI